jgi:hypothetical protein
MMNGEQPRIAKTPRRMTGSRFTGMQRILAALAETETEQDASIVARIMMRYIPLVRDCERS